MVGEIGGRDRWARSVAADRHAARGARQSGQLGQIIPNQLNQPAETTPDSQLLSGVSCICRASP
jgi:hypothetical protein